MTDTIRTGAPAVTPPVVSPTATSIATPSFVGSPATGLSIVEPRPAVGPPPPAPPD